ncbi:hypothetical protein QCN27_01680 [Cereibacter sp. SYSU M97828]|nr:hypothetical protein [Cereibacter flavus]
MRRHILLLPMLAALCACTEQAPDEAVRIMPSGTDIVVIRGLVDATRTAPPPRYDVLAAKECAKSGKGASFVEMKQRSTFAFDVTYRCT